MNRRPVVVWGNCQAPPVAQLIAGPLRALGMDVLDVAPVYLIDAAGLAQVYAALPSCAALVAQPVRDDYRLPRLRHGAAGRVAARRRAADHFSDRLRPGAVPLSGARLRR